MEFCWIQRRSRFWPASLWAFSASWSSRLLTHNLFKAEDFQGCFYSFSVSPVSQPHLRLNPHIQALLQNDVAASHHIFHFFLAFFIFAQHVFALARYPLTQTSPACSVSITPAQSGDDKITGSLKPAICSDWICYSVHLNKVQRLPGLLRLQQQIASKWVPVARKFPGRWSLQRAHESSSCVTSQQHPLTVCIPNIV